MTELLTAAEMRAIEQAAFASGEVTGLELMERAGRGVVEAVLAEWPDLAEGAHRAAVLSGPGNNGGDGFVVARLLKERGWEVEAFLYGDAAKLPPDARTNFERWIASGGEVRGAEKFRKDERGNAGLVVDALFGTGLTRPLEDLQKVLLNIAEAARCNHDRDPDFPKPGAPRLVAVDLPSGLSTDTGEVFEPPQGGQGAAAANLTVTFHGKKRGHETGAGPACCGKVVVVDIGLGPWDDARERA